MSSWSHTELSGEAAAASMDAQPTVGDPGDGAAAQVIERVVVAPARFYGRMLLAAGLLGLMGAVTVRVLDALDLVTQTVWIIMLCVIVMGPAMVWQFSTYRPSHAPIRTGLLVLVGFASFAGTAIALDAVGLW